MNNPVEQQTNTTPEQLFCVSLIIPVSNETPSLLSCLTAAVSQKMQETEIVIIDGSGSSKVQSVIDHVAQGFPGRIHALKSSSRNIAELCKQGLLVASAPYVAFVEPDDLVSGEMTKFQNSKVIREDADMILFRSIRFEESEHMGVISKKIPDASPQELIRTFNAPLWSAMYRKSLLLDCEADVLNSLMFEDSSAMIPLLTRTEKISRRNNGWQYFRKCHDTVNSIRTCLTEEQKDDFLRLGQQMVENVPQELRMACEFRAVNRAVAAAQKYPEIYDYIVLHVSDLKEQVDFERYNDNCFKIASGYPSEVLIPKIVYINGFIRSEIIDFDAYKSEAEKAYLFHPEVVVLDESSCDLSALPQWLKDGSNEDKGVFFALEAIAQKGGVYLSPAVKMITAVNKQAFTEAFFVAGPDNTVLPCLFGAMPEQTVVKALLDAIKSASDMADISLCQMLGRELIAQCGVHLHGREEKGIKGLSVLPFTAVCPLKDTKGEYCRLNYNNINTCAKDMLVLPQPLMNMACSLTQSSEPVSDKAAKELKKIKRSKAWKAIALAYKVRDKIKRKIKE